MKDTQKIRCTNPECEWEGQRKNLVYKRDSIFEEYFKVCPKCKDQEGTFKTLSHEVC